jgi:hypothetical protein
MAQWVGALGGSTHQAAVRGIIPLLFQGAGLYTYKITVYQSFPNGVSGEQSGGFAEWVQIAPPPYRTFLPRVVKP